MYGSSYLLGEDLLTLGVIHTDCPAPVCKAFSVHIVWKRKMQTKRLREVLGV